MDANSIGCSQRVPVLVQRGVDSGRERRGAAAVDELQHGVEVEAPVTGEEASKGIVEPSGAEPLRPPGDDRARLGGREAALSVLRSHTIVCDEWGVSLTWERRRAHPG
jgi:hypothetical protein